MGGPSSEGSGKIYLSKKKNDSYNSSATKDQETCYFSLKSKTKILKNFFFKRALKKKTWSKYKTN